MEKDIFWKVIPTPIPSPKYVEVAPKPSPKYLDPTPKPPNKTMEERPKLPPVSRPSALPVKNLMFIKDLVPEEKNKIAQLIQEVIRLEKENEEMYGKFLGLTARTESQTEYITAVEHTNTELTQQNSDLRHSQTNLSRQNSELVTENRELQVRVKEQAKLLRLPKRNVEIQCSPRQSHSSTQHTITLYSTGAQCDPEELSHCQCDEGSTQSHTSGTTISQSLTSGSNIGQSQTSGSTIGQSQPRDINLAQSQTMQKFVHQLNQLCDKLTVHIPAEDNKENNQSPVNVSVHRHDRDGVLVHPAALPNDRVFDIEKDHEWIRPDLISIVDEIERFDGPDKLSFGNISQRKYCKDTSIGFDDILTDLFFSP